MPRQAARKSTPARKTGRAAITAHQVQAEVEGVEIVGDGRKVALKGAEFRMSDKIGLMPLLRFAHASAKGVDSNDMQGLAAMYEVIRDCIDDAEWDRFQQHAIDTKAESEELLQVVSDVIEVLSARPTGSPSGSSNGRRPISQNSKGSSPKTDTPLPEGLTSVDSLLGR